LHRQARLAVDPLPGGHARLVLGRHVRGRQVGAGRQGVKQRADHLVGLVLVVQEVQHRDQHQRDRLAEVKHRPHHRRRQDLGGGAQVGLDVGGPPFGRGGEQCPRVREHHRVAVHVHDAGRRRHRLRHLVHVAGGGQAGADVEELPDPGFRRQEPHGPAEEAAVLAQPGAPGGPGRQRLVGDGAVGGEVVLAADVVVVHPGRMRLGYVDLRHDASVCSRIRDRRGEVATELVE
jgi:hypothetical protein